MIDSLLRGRARSQQGAVLYVVLVVLVLLALIGIVGMQVATMQERMSANYLAANMAFQRAESLVRDQESTINNGAEYEYQNCLVPYDPVAWVNSIGKGVVADVLTRNISICMQQCSASAGSDRSGVAAICSVSLYSVGIVIPLMLQVPCHPLTLFLSGLEQ